MESRATWGDLIPDVGLKIAELYDQGNDLYSPGVAGIMHVTAGEGAQKNYTGKTPAGVLKKFAEGDAVPSTVRTKTYTTKVVYNNYGESLQVTKNQIEDRDFGSDLDEMKDFSKMANYSIDESSMQLFNGGFATTVAVNGYDMTWYGDGNPQFSTVHATPVVGGSTQSNASSTGIILSHANYETGRLALQLQQTDNGLAMAFTGKNTLVVPAILEKKAKETIDSDLTPESGNNALNFFKGSADILTTVFLDSANGGSNTAWFIVKTGDHKLYFEERQAKRLEKAVDILTKTVTFTVDARWANYSKEWKGTWGSKGDLASYSS